MPNKQGHKDAVCVCSKHDFIRKSRLFSLSVSKKYRRNTDDDDDDDERLPPSTIRSKMD